MFHRKTHHHWYWLLTILVMIINISALPLSVRLAHADDDVPDWRGAVTARPATGIAGDWMIGNRTFVADQNTRLEESHGAIVVGDCAEVGYRVVASGYYAVKIERKSSGECGGSDDGGDHSGDHSSSAHYGRIEQLPAGSRVGAWLIAGASYDATTATRFEQEHGAFAIGACVEVQQSGTPPVVTKIATEHDYHCGADHTGGENPSPAQQGELYGVINRLPANLIGEWMIGDLALVADGATRFAQEHGAFAVGMLVAVKFTTDSANVNHIVQIESKYATEQHGHDDNGNGSHDGSEGHSYGAIDGAPAGDPQGAWTIAGLVYTVDANTRLVQEHGALTVGALVKVEFYLDAQGNRIATKIASTTENGGAASPDHAKLYGFVQQAPTNTFNGQWLINGVTLLGDTSTRFSESHGLLAVGSYVEVEYNPQSADGTVSGNIISLETQVPPGAGVNNHSGAIETNGMQAATLWATTWVIGGQAFVVTPATDLNDVNGALTVGSSAMVNSYTNGDGQEVATQIRGIVFSHTLFVPLVGNN